MKKSIIFSYQTNNLGVYLKFVFSLIYSNVSKKEQADMFDQMEQDVLEAVEDYERALAEEKQAKAQLAKRYQFDEGDLKPVSADDKKLAEKSVDRVRSSYKKKGKNRRDALEEYEKRVKLRDQKTLEWNSYTTDKKVNEIQFDGQTYTTRWTSLPA